MKYSPYVYVIGWSRLELFYVGVRYSKHSYLGDIWITYFTSSKHVKIFRKLHGEPDIIKILKKFDNKEEAINYEASFILKYKLVQSENWLNKTVSSPNFKTCHTEEWRQRMSVIMKSKPKKFGKDNHRYGIKLSNETKKKIGEGRKGHLHSKESKMQMSISKSGGLNVLAKKISVNHRGVNKEFPTFAALSLYLGLPKNSISKWIKIGSIPKKHHLEIICY